MTNRSSFHPDYFLLMGVPGLERSHLVLAFVFCFMYILALAGNATLILVISANKSLHQPMYKFLVVLAIGDLLLSTTTVPKSLSIFFSRDHEISFSGCLTQIFFVHFTSLLNSSNLLAMAYDRYVAICHPLSYLTKFTTSFIRGIIVISVIRNVMITIPEIFLTWRLPYRGSNVIEHTYCEFIGVARLATASIMANIFYGAVSISSSLLDLFLIGLSYSAIIRAIIRLSSSEARHKTFNTCVSHLCVLTLSYIPAYFSVIAHRIPNNHIPGYVHILMANVYVSVPPMVNPIIYGVRTKEIQQKFFKMLAG